MIERSKRRFRELLVSVFIGWRNRGELSGLLRGGAAAIRFPVGKGRRKRWGKKPLARLRLPSRWKKKKGKKAEPPPLHLASLRKGGTNYGKRGEKAHRFSLLRGARGEKRRSRPRAIQKGGSPEKRKKKVDLLLPAASS